MTTPADRIAEHGRGEHDAQSDPLCLRCGDKVRDKVQWNDLDEVEAARWCREERPGWPLDRSLRIWIMVEAGLNWNPDDESDQKQYDILFEDVLTVWRKEDNR